MKSPCRHREYKVESLHIINEIQIISHGFFYGMNIYIYIYIYLPSNSEKESLTQFRIFLMIRIINRVTYRVDLILKHLCFSSDKRLVLTLMFVDTYSWSLSPALGHERIKEGQ